MIHGNLGEFYANLCMERTKHAEHVEACGFRKLTHFKKFTVQVFSCFEQRLSVVELFPKTLKKEKKCA